MNNLPTKYQIIEKNYIDNFILRILTHLSGTKEKILFNFFFQAYQILIFSRTQGEILSGLKSNSNKFSLVLNILLKVLFKHFSQTGSPLVQFLLRAADLISYVYFLSQSKGADESIVDNLFKKRYFSVVDVNDRDNIASDNLLIKKMIWEEISNFIILFLPYKRCVAGEGPGKEGPRVCPICEMYPTNIVSFRCGHSFCYYCYRINSLDEEEKKCILCFKD